MKPVRNLLLAAAVLVAAAPAGPAAAVPALPPLPWRAPAVVPVQLVCGPYRCFRRPFWRYGNGRGFFPMRRFGPPPVRRFGYRPFGFGRFARPRRW